MKTFLTTVAMMAALASPVFAEAENPSDNSSATGSFKASEQSDRSLGANALAQYRVVPGKIMREYASGGAIMSRGATTRELDRGIK